VGKLRVKRKGYHRKGYYIHKGGKRIYIPPTYIPPTTYYITDRGKKGRGKKLIPVKRGRLSKYGYATNKSAKERHKALRKAVQAYGALSVYRMLNAQVVLRKRTQPKQRRIFKADRDWVKRTFM